VIARKAGPTVCLYSSPGNDARFPLIAETVARLKARSCLIDGEALVYGEDGSPILTACAIAGTTASFPLRLRPARKRVDLRKAPIELRKARARAAACPR
jgi:hypothetical protein